MKNNSCKLFFAFLISFLIVIPALPVFADSGSIQVKCLDASGNPVAGAKVVIISLKDQKLKDKKSDAQGAAEFTKVDNGVYQVVARKDGFAPALYEFVAVKGSQESVTLKMTAGADKKLYFEDPTEQQKVRELTNQAIEAYKQNKFADAEKLLEQCVEITPGSPNLLYYLGVSRLQQAKFDQGVEALNQASKIATELMTLPSPNKAQPNPYEQVNKEVQQLLKKIPAIKGENDLRHQRYDEAAADFKDAIKDDPNNPEYYANLAISLTNAKRFDEAMPALDKALQLKPGEKAYMDLKAQITVRKENAQLAKAQGIMDEGNRLMQDGDYAGALKKYEESRSMVPEANQSPLWRQIARAQSKLNQNDAAVASFKKSIDLAPADKVSEYRRAFAAYYLENKNYGEVVDLLAEPKTSDAAGIEQARMELAKAQKNKEPMLAEAALEKVVKANPGNVEACFDLGEMYYADGKEKDGRTKELLAKYIQMGKDPTKLESAKDMLVMINRRSK